MGLTQTWFHLFSVPVWKYLRAWRRVQVGSGLLHPAGCWCVCGEGPAVQRVALGKMRHRMTTENSFITVSVQVNGFMHFLLPDSKMNIAGARLALVAVAVCVLLAQLAAVLCAEPSSLLSYSSADWRVLNMYMYVRPGSGPMQNVMKLGCSDL